MCSGACDCLHVILRILRSTPPRLEADRDFVLPVLRSCGRALAFVSEDTSGHRSPCTITRREKVHGP